MRRPWNTFPTGTWELDAIHGRLERIAREVFPGIDLDRAEFELHPHPESTPDQPSTEIYLHYADSHVGLWLTSTGRRAAQEAGLLDL